VVRNFVELKARLTWNGFRADRQRRIGLPVAVILLVIAGLWLANKHSGVYSLISSASEDAAEEYLGWAALIAFLVWATLPVIIFPLDENLDPQQMASLPISPTQLVSGLTAASFVAPSIFVLLILGVVNGMLLPGGWWMILPASVVMAVMFVVGAQLVSASVSAVLRKRRGRDVATLLVFSLAGSIFLLYRSVESLIDDMGFVRAVLVNPILDKAWLIPPVGAQRAIIEAANGNPFGALWFLATAIAGLLLIGLVWRSLVVWMITTPREGSRPASRSRRNGMATRPWGRVLTLARKELRFYVRDPRQRLVWTGTVIFVGLGVAGAIMGTTGLFDIRGREWGPLVAPILVLFVGLPIALNLFGWERDAASYLFVLPLKPSQMLIGKNIAVATALAVETGILTIILAAVVGHWKWVWLVPPLMVSAIGCQLAVGNFVSVLTPLRLPREGTDVFAQSTEQGCLAITSQTLSFFAIGLLLTPPVSAMVLVVAFGQALEPLWGAAISIGWGLLLYGISLWISSALLRRRMPEVLGWVHVA
jgi:ABC-2 type transport system permease protein